MSLALTILRAVLVALALYAMWWTAPALRRVAHGLGNGIGWLRSAVFFLGAGTFAFQSFALFGKANDATRFMSSLTLLIGLGVAAYARAEARRIDKFGALFVFVGGAMAIVDLWRVDPEQAERIAADCRRLTAEGVSRGG